MIAGGGAEHLMVRKFIEGIFQGQLRPWLLEQQAQTLNEVLDHATRKVAYQMTADYFDSGKMPNPKGGGISRMIGDGSPDDYSMSTMQESTPSLNSIVNSAVESALAAMKAKGGGSLKCFRCGIDGHIAKNCARTKKGQAGAQKRQRETAAGRGRGPPMKKGTKKPEKPTGEGRKYRPNNGMHSMKEAADAGDRPDDSGEESSGEE
jgi:hypothetical protein